MNSKEAMREVQAGSDTSVQATASNAATGKMSAASLGYFEDRFLDVLAGDRMGGAPRRRLPPVMNRGQTSKVVVGEVDGLYSNRVACIHVNGRLAAPLQCTASTLGCIVMY